MDNALLVALLSALSALAGAAIAQWGANRNARLQADRSDRREALQWARQTSDKTAAVLAGKREAFLGFVLLAQNRMLEALERAGRKSPVVPPAESAASAARQAYAVALLYLADVRPLAKAFYLATVELQLALERADGERAATRAEAWRTSLEEIEGILSGHASREN